MHASAGQPLLHYHFGGDEVPPDAWKGSPICDEFMQTMGFTDNSDLKRYFFETVLNASFGMCATLLSKLNINILGTCPMHVLLVTLTSK